MFFHNDSDRTKFQTPMFPDKYKVTIFYAEKIKHPGPSSILY